MFMSRGFRSVSLMSELIKAIEKFLEAHPESGYKTKAEFVCDAVRRRMEEVKEVYPSAT